MSKSERLAAALDDLLAVSPDVEAAAVVSGDGLPIASALPENVQEDRLAAMSAALLTLGDKAAGGLGKGGLSQVFVEGEDGYVVLMAAGVGAVLVAVTSKQAKVGLVLFEMRRSAAAIAEAMDEAPQEDVSSMANWGVPESPAEVPSMGSPTGWDAPPAPSSPSSESFTS